MTSADDRSPLRNCRFMLFVISQCFVACSAFIQVVAVARLIVESTGSGLQAGFGIVCAPLPGIAFSLFAGSLGDRRQAKNLLIAFDILRGFAVLLFVFCRTAPAIVGLMTGVSLLDVLYSPSKNKLLTSLLGREALMPGNAVLTGGYGAVSLVVPMLTGLLLGVFRIRTVFVIGGLCYFLSAALLSCVRVPGATRPAEKRSERRDIVRGLRYCLQTEELKTTILTLAVFDFGTVSVNIAFYAFAFDVLRVTNGYWGLILSVLYGMNVLSMAFLYGRKQFFQKDALLKGNLLLLAVAGVWFFYSRTTALIPVLAGVAAEGLCGSLCTTVLTTHLLETARADYSARVMGIRDLFSNVSKIAGIGVTYLLMTFTGVGPVFAIIALAVFTVTVFSILGRAGLKKARRQPNGL